MTFSNRGSFRDYRGQSSYSRGGGSSFGGGNDRGPREMFDAICAKCGRDCQVPFRPNGRKEVLCSSCFGEANGESRGGFGSPRESRPSSRFEKRDNVSTYFAEKPMFDATCDECGNACQVPFQPRNGKPVLCSNCFAAKKEEQGPRGSSFSPRGGDNSALLEEINGKLDKILKLISPKEAKKDVTENILEQIQVSAEKKLRKSKKAKEVAEVAEEVALPVVETETEVVA